jgi:single-strand DNA-binding protein
MASSLSVFPSIPSSGSAIANLAIVSGALSSVPRFRALPSGSTVVNLDVTTAGSPADSVPITMFDPPAAVSRLIEGDEVVVIGRVRRRFFRAAGVTQSRTEVVAERIARHRSARSTRAALALATRRFAALVEHLDD